MRVNQNVLTLDIKVQDKLRSLIADMANGNIKMNCVMLGDSDIDYEISQDMAKARILNAPFNVEGIKYPLVYDGSGRGLEGFVTCFARKVESDGTVSSLYNYPTDQIFTAGALPPNVAQGYNTPTLTFDGTKMGYVVFFQTVLLNYYDANSSLLKRLNEKIDTYITFNGSETVPLGWEITKDQTTHIVTVAGRAYKIWNNSVLIAKNSGANLSQNANGVIRATGTLSNISKNITFNI